MNNYWQSPIFSATVVGKRVQLVPPITGQCEDLYLNGMLKDEFLNHQTIRRLTKRLLHKASSSAS